MSPRSAAKATPAAVVPGPDIANRRARHLAPAPRSVEGPHGPATVLVDDNESPLAWLARRRGRDGRPLIEPAQFQAGERLRADFTFAQMTPRMTAHWGTPVSGGPRGGSALGFSEAVTAARQRVRAALDAAGPEFAGLLLDVCCFLKTLPDLERERGWPARSAKVVLQLGLDRLARHYGMISGTDRRQRRVRTWLAEDAHLGIGPFEERAE